jgi:hypothetical protein
MLQLGDRIDGGLGLVLDRDGVVLGLEVAKGLCGNGELSLGCRQATLEELAFTPEDPACGRRSVWLARRRPA